MTEPADIVHACPPAGEVRTPCCGRWANELPWWSSRITVNPALVTCPGREREVERTADAFQVYSARVADGPFVDEKPGQGPAELELYFQKPPPDLLVLTDQRGVEQLYRLTDGVYHWHGPMPARREPPTMAQLWAEHGLRVGVDPAREDGA